MTTQFHALRLSSKITDAVVNFSKTHSVDLNTVDHWTSTMIIVGAPRCSKQIHIRKHGDVDQVKAGVYVTIFDTSGNVIETVNIEGVTLEQGL